VGGFVKLSIAVSLIPTSSKVLSCVILCLAWHDVFSVDAPVSDQFNVMTTIEIW